MRSLDGDSLKRVSNSAIGAKTRFVLIDAVGVAAACAPFDKPELREEIEIARREREQLIDHINLDHVTFAGFSEQAEAQALAVIQTFSDYVKANKDEIAALDFFYQQPYQRRALTFDMIEDLHERLSKPPLVLTTERLWNAYARVQAAQVKGWIFRHNAQRGTAFTQEQTEWLRLMKDHIASSCSISRDDFDYAELASKGGLQKAWGWFGKELDGLMSEMNEELVA